MIPSLEMAQELHKQYAPSQAAYDLIHTHCLIIATIGRQLAQEANARYQAGENSNASPESMGPAVPTRPLDPDLVYLGGLIHDIGTYEVLASDGAQGRPLAFDDRYIQHGLAGYHLLRAEGVDESVAEFARNHTGVGLTRQQVIDEHLDLPADDYLPRSLEQELVMYADNYHSKHQPPIFVSEPTAARKCAKFGQDNLNRWKMLVAKYGVPDLQALADSYHMAIT